MCKGIVIVENDRRIPGLPSAPLNMEYNKNIPLNIHHNPYSHIHVPDDHGAFPYLGRGALGDV